MELAGESSCRFNAIGDFVTFEVPLAFLLKSVTVVLLTKPYRRFIPPTIITFERRHFAP